MMRVSAIRKSRAKRRNNGLLLALGLICVAAIASGAFGGNKNPDPIRVYVFTAQNQDGFTDDELKQRNDSVEDLKNQLDRDSLIQIVSDSKTADVTLEVLARGNAPTGTTTTYANFGEWDTYPNTMHVVGVGLRAGTYAKVCVGTSSMAQNGLVGMAKGPWREAANNAAKVIEKWIKENREQLISKRPLH